MKTPLHLQGNVLREEARLDPSGPTVLVADDDASVRQLVALALELDGFRVVCAADGDEALARAHLHRPAGVILDAVMPGLSGIELSRRLRADFGPGPALVMLTGRTDVADRVAAFEAGADDYVVKPVRVTELVDRVKRRIERHGATAGRLLGSPEMYEELRRRITAGEPVSALCVAVDGLRAFSRYYSFARTERLLEWVGNLLLVQAAQHPDSVVGRLGADDFLVLTPPASGAGLAEAVVAAFNDRVRGFYDPPDAERGWIEITDRRDRVRRYRLVTLAVGIASSQRSRPGHHLEVVERAAEMAAFAHRGESGQVAVDRRR